MGEGNRIRCGWNVALASLAPNIWAFASPATMVESTLLLVSCFNLIIGVAIAMLWARYASATRKGGC